MLDDGASWTTVSWEQAEDSLGSTPLVVEGLRVTGVQATRVDNYPVVRVLHALADGQAFELYLSSRPFIETGADESGLFARKVESELFALGRAPISADSIRSLLRRLRDPN